MSDDLVRQLRCYADIDDAVYNPWVYGEAADRIEKLVEENADMQSKVATVRLAAKYAAKIRDDRIEKLTAALLDLCDGWECCAVSRSMRAVARKALEGKDA